MVVWLEEFGPLEIREVTFRLDGEIEITDRAALLKLEWHTVADVRKAFLVPYDDDWYISVYIDDCDEFDDLLVYKIIG